MRFRRAPLILVLAIASLWPASAAASTTVGHVFPAIDTAASIPSYSEAAARNKYVILQAWETEKMHSLKAANPDVEVLVYKNLAFTAELPSTHSGPSPSGVLYTESPDSWFLKSAADGQPFTSWGFQWLWAMDIGLRAYQELWAENVLAEMQAAGWDGVFIDDANATMKYHHTVEDVAKYPSDSSYSAAMGSALAYIGPRIRSAGKLAIPNFAAWVEAPATYNSWLQHVDGALDEMFCKWGRNHGEGYRDETQWTAQLNEAKYAASQGKDFLAYTQGAPGETQAARFGYATVMLASEGDAYFAFTPDYATENSIPEYDYDLGSPLGPESRDSNGVHRRSFERGLVVVNPTGGSRSVELGGVYSGSGLTNATAATMPAHSALVLTGYRSPVAKSSRPGRVRLYSKVGARAVRLRWASKVRSVRKFRVIRNGRTVATTSRRRNADRGVRRGRVYRYRVVGIDRHGRVVARSKALRTRPGVTVRHRARGHKRSR